MIGAKLGNWLIDKKIGSGGMGDVFLAHDAAEPARQAAIKVLPPEMAREEGFLQRFQREIEILRQLDHPNIVCFYESGQQDNRYFYAMEYVQGTTYERLLIDAGRMPWRDVLDMARQICPALKHAHDRGIIHRDLKPSNILRGPEGIVKLTDFGIAKVFAGSHLTMPGGVVGTAEYISPEQAQGKPATKRSDLYSVGILMYTLLTGKPPFFGGKAPDILHKHVYGRFDEPIKFVPQLPHDVNDVVCTLLEKDPSNRPADAGALQRRLEVILRKLDKIDQPTVAAIQWQKTRIDSSALEPRISEEVGPATLASQLIRKEMDDQNRGGPVQQFFNRPIILVALLLACTGLLTWFYWPASAEALFKKGAALMTSENAGDWDYAFSEYFEPLVRKYPDHPFSNEIEAYRQQREDFIASHEAKREVRRHVVRSEAQWFYQQGRRLRLEGRDKEAIKMWNALIRVFQDVPEEHVWVELAKRELALQPLEADAQRWESVRAVLEKARKLRDEGSVEAAERIWKAVEDLYGDDPSAAEILKEIRRDRGK